MRGLVLLGVLVACRRPLAPSETRCYSTPIGNSYATKCETGEAQPAVAPADSSSDDTPWWCSYSHAPDGTVTGSCRRTKGGCISYQRGMTADGFRADDCTPALRAACFAVRKTLTGEAQDWCSPSFATCRETRDYTTANATDDYVVLTECKAVE